MGGEEAHLDLPGGHGVEAVPQDQVVQLLAGGGWGLDRGKLDQLTTTHIYLMDSGTLLYDNFIAILVAPW